jgi:hypothetical protein
MITVLMLAIALYLFPATTWGQVGPISEPPIEKQTGWSILPNGMLVVEYDQDGNGKPDFFAVRIVTSNYFSNESLDHVKSNYRESLVFNVAYEKDSYYYITVRKPLFYAIDSNEDGMWDVEYKDELEDGINGNEKFYDSPSGSYSTGVEIGMK